MADAVKRVRHSSMWTLAEAVDLAVATTADAFSEQVGGWALIGALPPGEGADEWHFRTGTGGPVSNEPGEELALDDSLLLFPLLKTRPGPFARTILIGRSENNDVVIKHPSVSKLHARARRVDAELRFADAGSSNGTSHEGSPLRQDREVTVASGDRLLLGACAFQVFAGPRLHRVLLSFARQR